MPNFAVDFHAMGCQIQAWLNAPTLESARLLDAVSGWFEDWEAIFSRFRPESELSNLNRGAGRWVKVSADMFEVITLAVRSAAETEGLFNPLILPALKSAGYDHSFEATGFIPGREGSETHVADYHEIKLEPVGFGVWLPAHSEIDLGGIVKGWAAQHAAKTLSKIGPCLVNAGGDMVAIGSPDELGGWVVSIPSPLTDEITHTVLLRDSTIATSGTDYRQWTRGGHVLHHIIDPRTGRPASSEVLSASVIAPDAIHAEVWAKNALISDRLTPYPTLLFHHDGSTIQNSEFTKLCLEKTH